ncbi:MAG: PKD domain-containing protein [Euryarchaeota archaeon]|nr:PKD domain-containing protein [Euryarchaeota archaeon]MDE1835817.1 PKD domain-containing protein [Euryarchaeota archaeon]MDE1880532.1 PKD domain-containing protein [Euryarchaeota archaeon]MDE2045791.1 PKD domain-containing protein [Thermoplasmata archaeon]
MTAVVRIASAARRRRGPTGPVRGTLGALALLFALVVLLVPIAGSFVSTTHELGPFPKGEVADSSSAPPPRLTVAASPTSGTAPLQVEFWANVTGGTGTPQIRWSFGDGGAGSGSPIVHPYSQPGWYNATANATLNASGWSQTGVVTIHVTRSGAGGPPELSLSPVPSAGNSPLPVNLTISASGGTPPYSGSVCFGDGSPCVSLPSGWNGAPIVLNHTYIADGTFAIVASAQDAQGTSTFSTTALSVQNPSTLIAYGIESPGSGKAPLTVSFEAQASGGTVPYTAVWDFGDGTTATGEVGVVLTHTYTNGGTFIPALTIHDHAGRLSAPYTLSPIKVQSAPPPKSNASNWLTGGWLGQNSTTIGVLGLILVLIVFVLLVERRRREEITRQARELVEEMENARELP